MDLIVFSGKRYAADFRKHLLRAAQADGCRATHVQCGRGVLVVTQGENVVAEYRGVRSYLQAFRLLRPLFHGDRTIVLYGTGPGLSLFALFISVITVASCCSCYDVYDDFTYDATGATRCLRWMVDRYWRWVCQRVVILDPNLAGRYPGALHLDNASHLSPQRKPPTSTGSEALRLVYAGTIDDRTDFEFLYALAAKDVTLDIYGRVHPDYPGAGLRLGRLLAARANVRFLGEYDNDELEEILPQYQIGVVPYLPSHRLTTHINPDKIYHYLNVGLEVVSLPIPQTVRLADYIHIVDGSQSLETVLRSSILSPRSSGWIARRYTWDARWSQLRGTMQAGDE